MFPSENSPRTAEATPPSAPGWEAKLDRVAGDVASDGAWVPAEPRSWRDTAGRALGLARAFITLDDPALTADDSSPREPTEPPAHPHRQPLRPKLRSRRPGAAAPRAHHCFTPVRTDTPQRIPGWSLQD
jgi:hypothetical protein